MIYLLIIIAVTIIYGPHLWAKHVLDRYGREEYFSGNGFDFARLLLSGMKMKAVRVEETMSGDHYDPEKKVVRLTQTRCGGRSLTAVVVAAHEVGHAVQDQAGYRPLRIRTRMIRTAVTLERIGAALIFIVPVFTALARMPSASLLILLGGFASLCIPVFVHLLTLPSEFDASFRRALPILAAGNFIPPEDMPAARRILLACALTYVANALAGLLNIWRWIRILRR